MKELRYETDNLYVKLSKDTASYKILLIETIGEYDYIIRKEFDNYEEAIHYFNLQTGKGE